MPQPSADDQVRFLLNIQRLLNEGVFTATYKYAMLVALADIAVETGDDSGVSLTVPVERIAEKYIAYYWRQTLPYIPKGAGGNGIVLQQNTDRQAAVIRHILDARHTYSDSLADLQRDKRAWRSLVSKVMAVFWDQPLWRLQRIGDAVFDFLYDNRQIGTRVDAIALRPGRRVLPAPL